jgi:hypothetical protein
MERIKTCPVLSKGQDWQECICDTCAWYIYGKCAIVIIAEANDKTDEFGRLIRD